MSGEKQTRKKKKVRCANAGRWRQKSPVTPCPLHLCNSSLQWDVSRVYRWIHHSRKAQNLLSLWSPSVFLSLQADPTYRKVSNNLILLSILCMKENSKGYDFTKGSATCRHVNGMKWKPEAVRIFLQICYSIFWGLGSFFCHFTTKHTFHPIPLRAEHFCPSAPSLTLCAQPLSLTLMQGGFLSLGGTVLAPLPRTPSLPFKWLLFCFLLLVSSNTYIVWGETASIHTPQKAIHSRAAGEAQCSACPLHSWMSFVQSLGLESFPSQSQAINERWKKERKCHRVFSCSTIRSFFVCL